MFVAINATFLLFQLQLVTVGGVFTAEYLGFTLLAAYL